MPGVFLRTACIVLFYAAITGAAAWVGAEMLARMIDTCSGPAVDCGYSNGLAAVLIYHPLLWLASFVLLLSTRKRRLLPVFDGGWMYLLAPAVFIVIYSAFFVLSLL
jgi:hypothetical protein